MSQDRVLSGADVARPCVEREPVDALVVHVAGHIAHLRFDAASG